MSYFVVKHNENAAVWAGSPDVSVLTAGFVASKHGTAQFNISGLRTQGSEDTHWFWPSLVLSHGDQIDIAYLADGQQTEPASTRVVPRRSIQEILSELRSRNEAVRSSVPSPPRIVSAARSHRLTVLTASSSHVEATIGESEYLQAVVCFAHGQCKIEVDSLTVQSDGSTRGKRWLAEPLSLGESVSLTYAA